MKHTSKYCGYEFGMQVLVAVLREYPGVCQTCQGSGSIEWTESVPYGNGSVGMPCSDYCDACLGVGRCPKCGADGVWNEEDYEPQPCSVCGWKDGDPALYWEPECCCWEYEMDRELERLSTDGWLEESYEELTEIAEEF